jgi:propanol-preferring alcohol dehydrogenase
MTTKTMRAAVVRAFGQPLEITELPIPVPGPNQILVRTEACGVCHTDCHTSGGDWPMKPSLPFIPGHEGVGTVIATGSGVRSFQPGDRAGIPWLYSACGECEWCVSGHEALCPNAQYGGYNVNGGFAEYFIADARYAPHIPPSLSSIAAAPLLCAGVTTYKGLKETKARPGQWVAIIGVGGLGHVAIQYAKAMGLHVAAVDVHDEKLRLARQLGAEVTVNAASNDPVPEVLRATGGTHGVLVTAPSLPAFRQGVGITRRAGTCVLVGLPPGEFPLPLFDVVLKGLTVRGSLVGTRVDMREALEIAASSRITAHIETRPLESVNEVLDGLLVGTIQGRAVLDLASAAHSLALQEKTVSSQGD